jgi:glycosyltransferase involved in cell wall biosynthesis
MQAPIRSFFRLLGKGESKVAAVIGFEPARCHQAIVHLRRGAPDVPVWLFCQSEPPTETVALCQRVFVNANSLALFVEAERRLWPCWVAITVATWTGKPGHWPLKIAPLLIPPFRALLLNEHADFLAGTPWHILRHCGRRIRDWLHSTGNRAKDLGIGYWHLVTYHIWRSGPARRAGDEITGFGLLACSMLLPTFARTQQRRVRPFRRPLFRELHGQEGLRLSPTASQGGGILSFCQKGNHWAGAGVEQAAWRSDARWLLWRENERAPKHIDDMLPLFEDDRTFAVSRQADFRAWKSMLFPLAPFRTLQPGEATRVLAPLSPTILVDRRKLLALGVPRCSLAGSAWMILFWKAAAAGWRSYSIGQSGELMEQPDLPMQETGFLLHFLFNQAFRRLGPREPDLSRGNVAFEASRANAGSAGRPRVLLVSPFLPYPLSHGGAVRIFNLCRALADRVDYVLVAIREKHDVVYYDKLREIFRNIYVVDKDEKPSVDERLPEQVRQHELGSLWALVGELASIWKPDLLQIEYTHLAGLREAAPEVPAVLVEHDLTFSLYRQLAQKDGAGAKEQREYERWLEYERRWLAEYDAVWTVSDDDRESAIREGSRAPERTFAIPNGVDIERFVPRDDPTEAPEIFYVGSFRHLPNILGFEKVRDEVMPRVWKCIPQARLRVVAGPEHEEFWKRFAPKSAPPVFDPRVEIHGFVEDLRPLYAKAAVVVIPLEVSAGTNIKVLEAMACGKAVVTTPIGCAGLGLRHRQDALIEADWEGFARSVCELISDDRSRDGLATQARRTVEERFSWKAIAGQAYESYLALGVGQSSKARRRPWEPLSAD